MSKLQYKVASVAVQDQNLLEAITKLAYSQEGLRPHLLPIIKEAARTLGLKNLEKLHNKRGTFAILSAYRPLSKKENKDRHGELLRDLQVMGYNKGYDAKGYWTHTEKSLLVPNMSFKDAIKLGKKYDQDAIVYKGREVLAIYDLRDSKAQIVGPEIDYTEDEDAITKFRGTGVTYDLLDQKVPYSGELTQKDLARVMG